MLWVAFRWPFVIYWNSLACFLLRAAWNEGESFSAAWLWYRKTNFRLLGSKYTLEVKGSLASLFLIPMILKGLLGECFLSLSLKHIHGRLVVYLEHFTTSKNTTVREFSYDILDMEGCLKPLLFWTVMWPVLGKTALDWWLGDRAASCLISHDRCESVQWRWWHHSGHSVAHGGPFSPLCLPVPTIPVSLVLFYLAPW